MLPILTLVFSLFGLQSFAPAETSGDDARAFDEFRSASWREVFCDPCTVHWQDLWFLDGDDAKVSNDSKAMTIDTENGYAVLWTKPSFDGDLRIEYDFQRVDNVNHGVNILYIQATGDGQDGCDEDINKWSGRRRKAAMSDYFLTMHTYHISYATDKNDYIRGRRYLPLTDNRLQGTELSGEITEAGLFDDKEWIHVTAIKRAKEIWIEFKHPKKTTLCHFENMDKPPVTHGRVGLRLMPGRMSRFKNFQIMDLVPGNEKESTSPVSGSPDSSLSRSPIP